MQELQFSGKINSVFSETDKYSFFYDGKKLNLNLLEEKGVRLGIQKQEEFLMAQGAIGGLIGLYKNVCRNNPLDGTAIIYPSMLFIPKYINSTKDKFNRLLFKGKIINQLFPPIQKVKYDSARDRNKKLDGSKRIELKTFDETDICFSATIHNFPINCKFGVYWPGTINEKDTNLGELISYFEINFDMEKEIKEILQFYEVVRKFFQFLVRQKDVYFEEVDVELKNESGTFDKIGCFIDTTTEQTEINLSYNILKLIPNIGELFSKIAENELNYNFIPKDNFEAKYITAESYIKVCGAFEHNYEIVFKVLPEKDKYKLNTIHDIENMFHEKIKQERLSKKHKKYFKHIIDILNKDLNSVEAQFIRCLKYYKSALDDFLVRVLNRFGLKNEKLLGAEFAGFRNNNAHGGVIEFTSPSVCAFLLALVLIECMILEKSNYTFAEIKEIINSRYWF